MDLAESIAYLRHHLALPGRADPLIACDAASRLYRYANGLPRALNNATTAAHMAAAAEGKALWTTPAPSGRWPSSPVTEGRSRKRTSPTRWW